MLFSFRNIWMKSEVVALLLKIRIFFFLAASFSRISRRASVFFAGETRRNFCGKWNNILWMFGVDTFKTSCMSITSSLALRSREYNNLEIQNLQVIVKVCGESCSSHENGDSSHNTLPSITKLFQEADQIILNKIF